MCNSFVFGAFLVTLCCVSVLGENSFVSIEWGKIKGIVKEVQGKRISIFRNIPYAQEPVGDLRFRKPRPIVGKYDGEVFDATSDKTYCINTKIPMILKRLEDGKTESENCLHLHIYTPEDSIQGSELKLKPVLVYIFGGAYLMDDSREREQEGDVLAARGDMVVVQMNYRLGVFGCLFGDREDMPGNLPLEDQLLSLEWIKDNIRYFGGDPQQVTLSGMSAGSISVALHYMRPGASSLFQKVIMQSGALTTHLEDSVEVAKKRMMVIAKKTGCWKDDDSDATVECLRKADIKDLGKAYLSSSIEINHKVTVPHCLTQKGIFSQTAADERLIAGDVPHNIPALITSMIDEGSVIMPGFAFDMKKSVKENVRMLAPHWTGPGKSPEQIEDLIKLYFGGIVGTSQRETLIALLRLYSDRYFRCPSIWFAEKIMAHSPVYTAEYPEISKYASTLEPQILYNSDYGPRHGADCLYVFGDPIKYKERFPEEDVKMSERVIDIWVEFIRTGKLQWPTYQRLSTNKILPYQYQISLREVQNSTSFDPRYYYCQVWKDIYYGDKF